MQFNLLVSGTPNHSGDWAIIEKPLTQFLKTHGDQVSATFYGAVPSAFTNHPLVKRVDFNSNYCDYAATLSRLDVHAALVPLEDTEFNRGKSNVKWLEYSAAGIVGAYSDLTPYNSSVRHKVTGLLTSNHAESWYSAMEYLFREHGEAQAMLDNARREVHDCFSVEKRAGHYAATLQNLVGGTHMGGRFSRLSLMLAPIARAR